MNKIFLLHAYSPKNSGDGLLVKLSIDKIREIGLTETINVVCIDPTNFREYLNKEINVNVISIFTFLTMGLNNSFRKHTTSFYGVGGGYMRSAYFKEGLKTTLAHGSQLIIKRLFRNSKSFYFPQSVGPLKGIWGTVLKVLMNHIEVICVRDDKSLIELKNVGKEVNRTPDLVADKILEKVSTINKRKTDIKQGVCFVFRDLPKSKAGSEYIQKIKQLFNSFPNSFLALQSEGRGNNDSSFYSKVFDQKEIPSLKSVLKSNNPLVVSVRLHGSLETILNGVPSYHLSYERKGFAAYSDLGLSDYVQHAAHFDINLAKNKINYILNNNEEYWERIELKSKESIGSITEKMKALYCE